MPPPPPPPPSATSGNSEPALDKLLKPGQVLTGALATPSTVVWAPEVPPVPQWNWTQPVVWSTPSLDQVTSLLLYLCPGGHQVEKISSGTFTHSDTHACTYVHAHVHAHTCIRAHTDSRLNCAADSPSRVEKVSNSTGIQ